MKPFQYKLKHERYINKRIEKMTSTDLLNYLIDVPDGKSNSFGFIFKRDVFLEMCNRYKVGGGKMGLAILLCSVQKRLGLELQLNFKITDLEAETDKLFKSKYPEAEAVLN